MSLAFQGAEISKGSEPPRARFGVTKLDKNRAKVRSNFGPRSSSPTSRDADTLICKQKHVDISVHEKCLSGSNFTVY